MFHKTGCPASSSWSGEQSNRTAQRLNGLGYDAFGWYLQSLHGGVAQGTRTALATGSALRSVSATSGWSSPGTFASCIADVMRSRSDLPEAVARPQRSRPPNNRDDSQDDDGEQIVPHRDQRHDDRVDGSMPGSEPDAGHPQPAKPETIFRPRSATPGPEPR